MTLSGQSQAELIKAALVVAVAGVIVYYGKKFVDGFTSQVGSIADAPAKAITAIGGAVGAAGAAVVDLVCHCGACDCQRLAAHGQQFAARQAHQCQQGAKQHPTKGGDHRQLNTEEQTAQHKLAQHFQVEVRKIESQHLSVLPFRQRQ